MDTRTVILDTKGPGYAKFVKNGKLRKWHKGAGKLVEQAERQKKAAGNSPIKWHVNEEKSADAIRDLLDDRGITGVDIVHTP